MGVIGRRLRIGFVVAGLLVAGCTPASAPDGSAPSPRPQTVTPTPPSSVPDLQLRLNETYSPGDRAIVRLRNVGDESYRYQTVYQACFLTYLDATGRSFKIPPGTHCDILAEGTLRPGETTRLFSWDLDECVKDQWGCVRRRPLAPGTYTISGTFREVASAGRAHVETSFEIVSRD